MKTQAIRWWINGFLSLLAMAPLAAFALTPSQVFEKVKDSILVVKAQDTQGKHKAQGSGVMLPNGKVVTNCHVLKNRARFQVGRSEQFVSVTLYAEDLDKDLCLLEVKGLSAKPVQLGKAAALKVGEAVYAVGSPKGLELSLSDGIVSQLRGDVPPIIQTTAAISPGSSGGGLFDAEGRLVGITTLYLDGGQSLNFAMPVEWLASIQPSKKLATHGKSLADWVITSAVLGLKEDWQGNLDWCRQWTRADPGNAWAWYDLGVAYTNLKHYTDAIEAYRTALRIRPDYANAWYNLGVAYANLNRTTDAIAAYRETLRIKSDYAEAWYNLGVIYAGLNRYTDAIDAFRQAVRSKPNYANAWYNLGAIYGNLMRYTDAIEAFRETLRTKPDNAEAWEGLGLAYARTNRYTDAIEAFHQALRIKPDNAEAWGGLGLAYAHINRNTDAIEAFREALRIKPDSVQAWVGLVGVYDLSGNKQAALEAVRELRRYDPQAADKLFNMIMPK